MLRENFSYGRRKNIETHYNFLPVSDIQAMHIAKFVGITIMWMK